VTVAGNSLGGCVALRAAERAELPIDAVVPIAPAGLDMPRWFAAIEASPAIQAILRSPLPIPDSSVRRLVGAAYRRLVGPCAQGLGSEQVATFASHLRSRRDVIRILAPAGAFCPSSPRPSGWSGSPVRPS
jgi:pimeloyl-ACP methyl ester carboxylesterase